MKILLVDGEEQVLKGVSRIISCEEDEWEVETADSGEVALGMLSDSAFDVVISDMRMAGMDGAEFLDQVEKNFPKTMRLVLSGDVDRETVLRAVKPMHQYLSKPCDPDRLFEAISCAALFQETIKSAEVLDAIGRANCLPSFPEVVSEINEETNSSASDASSIGKIVSQDHILSAKLLQLANSAIFPVRQTVADIDRAVAMVGLDMVRSLAMSQAVYSESDESSRMLSVRQLFEHGLAVAVIGRRIAKLVGMNSELSNVVFSAGLLHDVGKLVLSNAFPDKYKLFVEGVKQQDDVAQFELDIFGATHQGVGGYLFQLWGLPAEVTESVAAHHSFVNCANSPGKPRQLVFAANWIAHDKSASALQALVDEAAAQAKAAEMEHDVEAAQRFADQINEWQAFIAASDNENEND